MRSIYPILIGVAAIFALPLSPAKADFGDADFPIGMFKSGPKSYHDALCRSIKTECRVRFQGPAMWVEGQGGIQRSQLIRYRYEQEGKNCIYDQCSEYYNYISYMSSDGKTQREALFLFQNKSAQRDFVTALVRWKRQKSLPIPNYRYPASQGPQDTHGRDKGLNPYDNRPITDWSEKTTEDREQRFKNQKPWED